MVLMDIGRVCRIVRGKHSGADCVIVDIEGKGIVTVDGEDIKRKKANIMHLEPLPVVLKIKKGVKKEELLKALAKADLP